MSPDCHISPKVKKMLYVTGLPYFVTIKKMLYVTGLPYFVTGGELISCLSSPCRDLQLLVKPQLGCNRHPFRLHLSCFGPGVVSVDMFMETISGDGGGIKGGY